MGHRLRKGPGAALGLLIVLVAHGADEPLPSAAEGAPADARAPAVMDRIVAVVGDRLITASDVALETALNERDPSAVEVMRPREADPLRALVDAAVIRGLAGQVPLYQPSPAELRARLQSLRATWEDPSDYERFLAHFGLDEDALSGILFSRMIVERYVHRNVGLGADMRGEDLRVAAQEYESRVLAWREAVPCRLVPARRTEGDSPAPGPCP